MKINSQKTKYEDFVGFTFNGIHSSDLNLIRVNDGGERYTKNLIPSFQDKTVQIGGRHGAYLFGSDYQKQEFSINVAFDNVGEEDLRKIQNWGADQKIHKLIFDEQPYKYYNVKLSKAPQIKYLCFDESENRVRTELFGEDINKRSRIYKGEATFDFVCYEVFGRSTILSKKEIYESEPDLIKIYLSKKNCGHPIEIPIESLTGVDEVAIYLSSDVYNRGEWGLPNKTGEIYDRGQIDPNTEEASTSYYAYQPQKIILQEDLLNSNINLISDYQTYLYPIDLNKGFYGTIEKYTGETNGKLIDKDDPFYDFHQEKRKIEIVQYDPLLKITYGPSSESTQKDHYEEYGVFKIVPKIEAKNNETNEIKTFTEEEWMNLKRKEWAYVNLEWSTIQVESITEPIAKWTNGELKIIDDIDQSKIYTEKIFCTIKELEQFANDFDNIAKNWTNKEKNRMFIVKCADNTYCSNLRHSLFLIPNDSINYYFAELRFKKDGESHVINLNIELTDEEDPILENKNFHAISQHTLKMCNYNEWINYLNLPDDIENCFVENIYNSFNSGDLEMPFQIYIKDKNSQMNFELSLQDTDKQLKILIPHEIIANLGDQGVCIDTDLRIIRGFNIVNGEIILNQHIYNQYIKFGDFFYIPTGNFSLIFSERPPEFKYEYRYL